ncbi:MAG: LPXTG-motif cell wall anchor domain protein, partial [Lacrimispora sp.]|nr:LPXTG-motif cell wall anchor domain protein [Lacrimispora sp.]
DTTTAVPGLEPRTGSEPVGTFTWSNESVTDTGYKLVTNPAQPTSMTITAAGLNQKIVYYEVDEDQTLNYTIKYFYNNSEESAAEENLKVLVANPTVGQVQLKAKAGYQLSNTPYSPELPAVITQENHVINVYYDPVQVDYVVNLYYQVNGEYTEEPTYSYNRSGYTESAAEVTADDKEIKKPGYVFDEGKENVLGGAIAGDGSLVLKAYFKQQFTVTYAPGTQGTFDIQKAEGLNYNATTPEYDGKPTGKPGYVFAGWSPKLEPVVTADNTYVAQWISSTSTKYTVEFYYENKGKYPAQPNNSSLRAGTTDALAAVTDSDKTGSTGYILDSNAANVFEATVAGDGGMVLRVYFKQQFTVAYNPGEHGSFKAQTNTGLNYGDAIPAFEGQTSANGNYSFIGWNKEIGKTVTEDAVYTALWSYNGGGSSGGSGSGGSSSGGGPRTTGTRQAGGPGDTTVTIEPVPVPLANLPEKTNLVSIDDGNIPLAGLPKTGDRTPIQGVAAIVSGILLAAYLAISHKRREER